MYVLHTLVVIVVVDMPVGMVVGMMDVMVGMSDMVTWTVVGMLAMLVVVEGTSSPWRVGHSCHFF